MEERENGSEDRCAHEHFQTFQPLPPPKKRKPTLRAIIPDTCTRKSNHPNPFIAELHMQK